jgi:ligand-binding sensor domain-containing protein/putative methionine-R-sulfoxide reductase with GAF domain
MRICRLIIKYVPVYFIALHVNAQSRFNYNFRHIGRADGLLHNDVYSIAQDHKGFIWIATANGLQRYDGSSFINFTEMLKGYTESRNEGAFLYADKKSHQLWVCSNKLEIIDLDKRKFTVTSHEDFFKPNQASFTQYTGINNTQWLLGNKALYLYDSILKKYSIFNFSIHPANVMAKDTINKYTWFTAYTDLYLFDESTKQMYSKQFNPTNHPLLKAIAEHTPFGGLRYIMIDSRQDIWFTTWSEKICRYDSRSKKLLEYSLLKIKNKEEGRPRHSSAVLASCMLEDSEHTIWIGTENAGLLRYNPAKDNFDYCIASEKNTKGIKYNFDIRTLIEDKEQNIWVCGDKGINVFNPYRQYFKAIRREEGNNNSLPKNNITSFIQASTGDLFIGTWGGGVSVYGKNFAFKKSIDFNDNIDKNRVWSLIQADDKTVWAGCQHGYVIQCDAFTGSTKTIQPQELEHQTIRCMEKDKEGNIWFGLNNGKIAKWDKQTNNFLPYGAPGTGKDSSFVFNIFIDKEQNCWVSTKSGFKQFDLKKRVYINHWLPDKNNTTALYGKTCNGIEEYNDSILLVGTNFGGLNFFNKRTKTFSHFTRKDGLPSDNIYAIKKDSGSYIWFTTDNGLYKFSYADKKYIPVTPEPGLINASFFSNRFYPLQDGQWLTLTTTEAISFSPFNNGYQNADKLKTEITGFKIFDNPIYTDSLLTENKPVKLSYKENFFTIEFASLVFSSLQQINYFYRLNGIDKDWVNGGIKRFANYTDLQPGEYLFEVRADNASNTGDITAFKIIITPPFWKTGWFIFSIVFCILLLSFLFIRGREKSLKAVAAAKLKVQQLSAEQYKNKLELEQIINYFSSSLNNKTALDEVLWDTAKNLIGKIGFVDCMIYLWNDDKTKMVQRAGFGPKGSIEEIKKQIFDVVPGQGVVGYVMQTKEPVLIPDTSKDSRYRPDEMIRLSEITVPVIYNDELIGVIDSEHPDKNFFTARHLQIMGTIATLMADKIKSIEAEQSLQQKHIEIHSMNEELSAAKLEALQSQMNPHFIFNCINSIDALIHSNDKYNATVYLNKFAKLLRNILDSSKQNTVSFSKDIETLKLYIELEELRNENKFKTRIKIDKELLDGDYKVPPLIVQPFVENAILHGLKNKEANDGVLTVHIKKMNEKIQYNIIDNGIGRTEAAKIMQNKESHYGMQMSYDRIKLFNKEKIVSVQVNDLYNNNIPAGTEVIVHLNMM